MLLEETGTAGESDGLTVRDAQILELRAFQREQAMAHGNDRLEHGAHSLVGAERAPALLDPSDDGVLDRNDAGIGRTFVDGTERGGKSAGGNALDRMPPDLGNRRFGVSSVLALKRHPHEKLRSLRLDFTVTRAEYFLFRQRVHHAAPERGIRGSQNKKRPRLRGPFVRCVMKLELLHARPGPHT